MIPWQFSPSSTLAALLDLRYYGNVEGDVAVW
jgi:hypothetical protein